MTDQEFTLFQRLIYERAGVHLPPGKKVLLVGRLGKRLQYHGLATFTEYYRLLTSQAHAQEAQHFIDLVTTHETYFFREPQHFDFLRDAVARAHPGGRPLRVWSAACSSGEEPYTIAMVLADALPHAEWEVFASDISQSVLEQARAGLYPAERARGIPPEFLRRFCLKGVRSQAGKILVAPELRERVRFAQVNLTAPVRGLGSFDVIFLRNAMIYFDAPTKRRVVDNLLPCLAPDGYFIVGHAESLNGVTEQLRAQRPTIYRRAPGG